MEAEVDGSAYSDPVMLAVQEVEGRDAAWSSSLASQREQPRENRSQMKKVDGLSVLPRMASKMIVAWNEAGSGRKKWCGKQPESHGESC